MDINDPDYQTGYAVGRLVGALIAGAILSVVPWTIAHRREMDAVGNVAAVCIFAATYFVPLLGLVLAVVFSIALYSWPQE